jgi:hypothetical protein
MSSWQDWAILDFSSGYIDSVDDNLLPESAARDCRNFISKEIGRLRKRKGQIAINKTPLPSFIQGLYAFYLEPEIKQLIAASDGKIYRWEPISKKFLEIHTGFLKTSPIYFETCANYMVGFDGKNPPFKYNGIEASPLMNAPASGQFPTLYKEKLFVNPSNEPSQIWWSESFYPEEWPAVNYWSISEGDGDRITNLMVFQDALLIFKNRSIHVLRGTNLNDFRLERLENNIGCVGAGAAKEFGGHIYFVGQNGLYVFNGLKATNISEGKIFKLWDKVNLEHIDKAAVTVWNNKIWFSLPTSSSTINDLTIICDPNTGSFWPMSGIEASCFKEYAPSDDIPILFSGHTTEGYVVQQDVGYSDFGEPIKAYWIGRSFDQNNAFRLKKAKKAFIEDSPDTDNVVQLWLALDYENYIQMEPDEADGITREYRFPSEIRRRWRYISPKFTHEEEGACEVRGLMIPYKIKRKPRVKTPFDGY